MRVDTTPQSAEAPKPDAPAAAADPRAPKATETPYEYLKRLGIKIANDDLPNSGGITIVGTGQPSEPEVE